MGCAAVAGIMGNGLWQAAMGADPDLIEAAMVAGAIGVPMLVGGIKLIRNEWWPNFGKTWPPWQN